MRIIHMLPAYAGLSFLSICWPETYVYLTAWIEYFQALALYAFTLLLIDFLAPTEAEKFAYFRSLKVKKIFRKGKYRDGVSFLKLTFYCVLQYPICTTILGIIQCITQATNTYCLNSDSPSFAHLWVRSMTLHYNDENQPFCQLKIVSNASLSIAVTSILRFYNICKNDMKELHPLRKLLAFKLVVGVIFFESVSCKDIFTLSYYTHQIADYKHNMIRLSSPFFHHMVSFMRPWTLVSRIYILECLTCSFVSKWFHLPS